MKGMKFMKKRIKRGKKDYGHIEKCFQFINELLEANGPRIHNLIMVGFLEVLSDEDDSIAFARKYLSHDGVCLLDENIDYWNGNI